MKAVACVMLGALLLASQAFAGNLTGDRGKIGVGGYALSDFDANITLEDADSGAGISISPIETLGMDFNTTVFRIDGGYRFSNAHSMQFSWYRIASTGTKVLGQDIEWDDITIPATATVSSELKYDIVKLGYLWSFYHNDKVELGVGAGVHVTRLSLLMNATFAGTELETQDVNTTVPLPVVMFVIAYRINDKWRWAIDNQWFSMNFERIRGGLQRQYGARRVPGVEERVAGFRSGRQQPVHRGRQQRLYFQVSQPHRRRHAVRGHQFLNRGTSGSSIAIKQGRGDKNPTQRREGPVS